RLEVPTDLVEDEQVVVFEAVVDHAEEPGLGPLRRPEQLRLRPTAPTAQSQTQVRQTLVVDTDHAAGAGRGDDVRQGKAGHRDVRTGAGGSASQRRAERVTRILHH